MFALTGLPLLIVVTVGALVLPWVVALRWRPQRLRGKVLVGVVVVLSQLLAIGAVSLAFNREYTFYTTWGDLFGTVEQSKPTPDHVNNHKGGGTVQWVTVEGRQVMVWLPQQYSQPELANTRFPVVMFLPGQPSRPSIVFNQYDFGTVASRLIDDGSLPPFVAVFPPIMTDPPRDTECTDIPGGPQAQTWLSTTVPNAMSAQFRLSPPGQQWSVMGWSTGGFCALKVALKNPDSFGSAVSFGGYAEPYATSEVAPLFAKDPALRAANSPLALYEQHRDHGPPLLLINGRQDRSSWPLTTPLVDAARGDKNVTVWVFDQGGHNYRNYGSYLDDALVWAHDRW